MTEIINFSYVRWNSMRLSKKHLINLIIVVLLTSLLSFYQLPYYIYKPGRADALDTIVVVEDGYESEGSMHLLTVTGSTATPISYLLSKIMPFHEVRPLEQVRRDGESDEEYMRRQLHMMEDSQLNSTIVAYKAAKADIEIINGGVYVVATVKDMPAAKVLKPGDIIKRVDDIVVEVADDLVNYVATKKAGEVIQIERVRNGQAKVEEIEIIPFPDDEEKVGIGIQLTTHIELEVDPEVNFSSGRIGGPSAGLMFALTIYDQLVEEDLTRGKKIAGTGRIDSEGNVHPVGGVDKKVVAADREGSSVFFVPYEQGKENSNYEVALEAAKKIKTKMDIVPVDTFEEALQYLKNLSDD